VMHENISDDGLQASSKVICCGIDDISGVSGLALYRATPLRTADVAFFTCCDIRRAAF